MKILLLTSAHNGLSRRTASELATAGYDVDVAVVASEQEIGRRVPEYDPDLIVCPMLTKRIPAAVWQRWHCLILHPGVVGDQGPSSLDWAIQEGQGSWGVTVVEAADCLDGGDIWATETFRLRGARKTSVYRREVTDAGVRALLQAVRRFDVADFIPTPLVATGVEPRPRPLMSQTDRRIDWAQDPTDVVLRKLWGADGRPGVEDVIEGQTVFLFGGHREGGLVGPPGTLLARRDGAICRATVDGAVWVTQARRPGGVKLPASMVLSADELPEAPSSTGVTWHELSYREEGDVGYLAFEHYNGAVSSEQALALRVALRRALRRPTRVLVLLGGEDFFCNGIHLGVAHVAPDPGLESWRNLQALNDVVLDLIEATDKRIVSALRGDAAAGGVMLALAADEVICRDGVMLSPHYASMGLFGSEYWTYLLPRRAGAGAAALAADCVDLHTAEAVTAGLVDRVLPPEATAFSAALSEHAQALAGASWASAISRKRTLREADERVRPLIDYRAQELRRMHRCFFEPTAYYHAARAAFFGGADAGPVPESGAHIVDGDALELLADTTVVA